MKAMARYFLLDKERNRFGLLLLPGIEYLPVLLSFFRRSSNKAGLEEKVS